MIVKYYLAFSIFTIIFLGSTNTKVSLNIEQIYSFDSFGTENLDNLNWAIDTSLKLIVKNDFKCEDNKIFKCYGEISLYLNDKRDSTISHFILRSVEIGETSWGISDYTVIDMGANVPKVIIMKISYGNTVDNAVEFVRLFKLECKDGRLAETEI